MSTLLLLAACGTSETGRASLTDDNSDEQQQALTAALRGALEQGQDGSTLDLSTVARFEWDTLFLFGEHTSGATINKQLGQTWVAERQYLEEMHDLLVFVKDGNVVQYVVTDDDLFTPLPTGFALSRDEAIFEVRAVEGGAFGKVFVLGSR